jgi:hypothetical protein
MLSSGMDSVNNGGDMTKDITVERNQSEILNNVWLLDVLSSATFAG